MHTTTFGRQTAAAAQGRALRPQPHFATPRPLYRHTAVAWAAAACTSWAMAQTTPSHEVGAAEAVAVPTQTMPEVHVQAERIEARTYDRAEMDATPAGNRDLTSLIANHPAVRTNPAESNGNRGSLAPESFSIHGESPYQNQFLIDGISGTNVINPQESDLSPAVDVVPGFSQAYNIDTDLLEQVQVYDNRIPVEFGRFQGGVVDARIKTPTGSNRFSLKRSFNSSNLTQQQMPEQLEDEWTNGEPGYASRWKKHFTSVQGDIKVTEDSAALISFSRRESLIQRQAKQLDLSVANPAAADAVLVQQEEKDSVDNLLAKLHTRWGGGTESSLLLKYADRKEDLVSNSNANSSWTNRQKAMGLSFDISHAFDGGKWTSSLGVDQLDSRRESDSNEYITQQFMRTATAVNSALTYIYGGLGNASLDQRQYTAKTRLDLDVIATGAVRHKMYVGADLQSIDASFERDADVNFYTYRRLLNGTQNLYTHHTYRAGTVDVGYNSIGLYASDTMQLGNWAWTIAARVDRENFLKNTNVSPWTRLDWDVWGNDQTKLGIGWSRYFGMDMLGYALEQGKDKLLYRHITSGVAVNNSGTVVSRSFDGLKTPHSDEWALNWIQKLTPSLEANFSYVNRASRDELSQSGTEAKGYVYTNDNSARTKTAALSVRTLKPWKALAADWTGRADFTWQDVDRSHDSTLGWAAKGFAPDDEIEVDGVKMQRKDKPASGFSLPRRVSWGVTGEWKQAGVAWGNRVNWNSGRKEVVATSTTYLKYITQNVPSYWTWDASLTYKPAQLKGLTLNVDVLNVLNKMPALAVTRDVTAYVPRYQTGREIWLTAAYEF